VRPTVTSSPPAGSEGRAKDGVEGGFVFDVVIRRQHEQRRGRVDACHTCGSPTDAWRGVPADRLEQDVLAWDVGERLRDGVHEARRRHDEHALGRHDTCDTPHRGSDERLLRGPEGQHLLRPLGA